MWERLTAPEDGFSKLQRENLAIIESYGKALMEVVCRDACDGHEISRVMFKMLRRKCFFFFCVLNPIQMFFFPVIIWSHTVQSYWSQTVYLTPSAFLFCQMLALAVLDRILSIDRQNQWLLYVCNSGYLRSLVESLRQDDVALQSLLTPQPPLLKPLYIYESKMVRKSLFFCVLLRLKVPNLSISGFWSVLVPLGSANTCG